MNETRFLIKRLDNGWGWPDITDETAAEIYCSEELEVPMELVEELHCVNNAIKISLQRSRTYVRDDWYVNLQRVAS